MWTWSGWRCPSTTLLSFCRASSRNTSPRFFRSSPYNCFRRHFGIHTTWYLQSHFVWLKHCMLFMKPPFSWLWAVHVIGGFFILMEPSNCCCPPAKPGVYLTEIMILPGKFPLRGNEFTVKKCYLLHHLIISVEWTFTPSDKPSFWGRQLATSTL